MDFSLFLYNIPHLKNIPLSLLRCITIADELRGLILNLRMNLPFMVILFKMRGCTLCTMSMLREYFDNMYAHTKVQRGQDNERKQNGKVYKLSRAY